MAAVSAEPFFLVVVPMPPFHVPELPGFAHSTVAPAFGAPAFGGLHQQIRDEKSGKNVPKGSDFHAPSRRLLAAEETDQLGVDHGAAALVGP